MNKNKEKICRGKRKHLRYNKSWEQRPQFQEWLGPLSGDPKSAYCKVCRRPLHPSTKDLEKHADTKKHKLNYARNLSFKEYGLIPTDLNLPVTNIGDSIKCEAINNSLLEADLSTSYEKQSITIKLFPSDKGDGENMDLLDESFLVPEEVVGMGVVSQMPVESMQSLPEYRDWLVIAENNASCGACKVKFKCTQLQIYKHSIGKVHLEKCSKNSFQVAPNSNRNFDSVTCSTIKFSPEISYRKKITIDLRSDLESQQSDKMVDIMAKRMDAVQKPCTSQNSKDLEKYVANMLNKEEGLIFNTVTMANFVSVLTHCWQQDADVYLDNRTELYRKSSSAVAKYGSIPVFTVSNKDDGTFCLEELENSMKYGPKRSSTFLICIETPFYNIGGKIVPIDWIEQVAKFCAEKDGLLHMNGTRLLNASLAYGCTPDIIVENCDSCTFGLDKGLGTPIGAVMVGSHQVIKRARQIRKMLEGTLQASNDIFAESALTCIELNRQQLPKDHQNAKKIAQCVNNMYSTAITVKLEDTHTNVVHLYTDNIRVTPTSLCERLAQIRDSDTMKLNGVRVQLMVKVVDERTVRLVTHLDISEVYLEFIMKKLILAIQDYDNSLSRLQL